MSLIYQEILKLKRIRDSILHGFGDTDTLLVNLPYFGLVPVSWENYKLCFSRKIICSSKEMAEETLKTINRFEKWLENNKYTKKILMYLSTGFEIPLSGEKHKTILMEMQNIKTFEKYLQEESEAADYYTNQYDMIV